MSKKPQPQTKQNIKHKIQIVDEQNEPFIKSLQKRIRNINKKLTQIDELSKKDNLKPQQIEKINRKEALLEQRVSLQSTITFYKESYTENAQHYRNIQLRQLELLARGIVIGITNPNFPQNSKLQKVSNALNSVEGNTFNQAVANLFNSLKEFSNDRKLQKLIQNYTTQNGDKAIDIPIIQNRPLQTHTDQVIVVVQQVTNEKGQNLGQIEIVQKIHDGIVENVEVHVIPNPDFKGQNPLNEVQAIQETPTVTSQNTSVPVPKVEQQFSTVKAQTKEQRPQTRGQYRDKKPYKGGNQGQKREYKKYEDRPKRQQNGEKRQYKPKYQEKPKNVQNDEEASDSSSQPESRNFKRDQIKQLEEEGFIVVGKPKPKARDQQQVYDKQHGRKHHYHNTNKSTRN